MSSIESRPATAADITCWYGAPPRWTLRAATLWLLDGAPVAVAAYYVEGARAVVFSELRISPRQARRYGRHVLRGAVALLAAVRAAHLPACAIPDPAWPCSERLLERLGFVKTPNGVWVA